MAKLHPLKLHTIIGTSTEWTDELWDDALHYLLENTSTLDVLAMTETLPTLLAFSHKIDYLREFHNYPPTLVLGAFDLMRALKSGRHTNAQPSGLFAR
jgi:hypothetical protein